jgi:ATP-dependent Clp protease, protease subunit
LRRLILNKENQSGSIEIKNKTNKSADLYIYGYIADEKWYDNDIIPNDVKDLLDEVKEANTLNIYINSGGGSVFAGMAIYHMLSRIKAHKSVFVDGLAGSIASVIAFCGDELIIPSNSYLMIHKAWTFAVGNADELLKTAESLETIDKGILNVYSQNLKSGITTSAIKDLIDAETWLTGEQANEYFDIHLADPLEAVACGGKLNYINTPKVFKENQPEQNKLIELLKLECEL